VSTRRLLARLPRRADRSRSPGRLREHGSRRSRITFRRTADLVRTKFVDLLTGVKRCLACRAGVDGAYLRFAGTATLERFEGGRVAETVSQESAVWELMYFARAPR
jgi:hypothetical protein